MSELSQLNEITWTGILRLTLLTCQTDIQHKQINWQEDQRFLKNAFLIGQRKTTSRFSGSFFKQQTVLLQTMKTWVLVGSCLTKMECEHEAEVASALCLHSIPTEWSIMVKCFVFNLNILYTRLKACVTVHATK